jgi:hypothetical protein
MHRSSARTLSAARALVDLLLVSAVVGPSLAACVKDDRPECLSLGSGWLACPGEMAAVDSGPAVVPDSAAPSAAVDGGSVDAGSLTGPARAGGGGGTAVATNQDGGPRVSAGTAGQAVGAGGPGAGLTQGGSAAGFAGSSGVGAAGRSGAGGIGGVGAAGGVAAVSGALSCCHALGRCQAAAELAPNRAALFSKDSCDLDGALCVPAALSGDAASAPKTCRSVLDAEGRCLPDCISNLALQAARLPKDVCAEHEVCAACFDPVTGDATGYCALGGDSGPRESPRVFANCCDVQTDAQALCVPQSYVPAGVVMPRGTCDATSFCVPRAWASDPSAKPNYCTDDVRGRGICVPQCVATALGPLLTTSADCNPTAQCYPCQYVGGLASGVCAE